MRSIIASLDAIANELEQKGFVGLAGDMDAVANTVQGAYSNQALDQVAQIFLDETGSKYAAFGSGVIRSIMAVAILGAAAHYGHLHGKQTDEVISASAQGINEDFNKYISTQFSGNAGHSVTEALKDGETLKSLAGKDSTQALKSVGDAIDGVLHAKGDMIAKKLVPVVANAGMSPEAGSDRSRAVKEVCHALAGNIIRDAIGTNLGGEVEKVIEEKLYKALESKINSSTDGSPALEAVNQAQGLNS